MKLFNKVIKFIRNHKLLASLVAIVAFLSYLAPIMDLYKRVFPEPPVQPSYYSKTLDSKGVLGFQRYISSYRQTTFLGRDLEIGLLKDFATQNRLFSWWLLCGGAGTGKSRLALEFCLLLDKETPNGEKWQTGFVNLDNTGIALWEAWQPLSPTFLVFDNVADSFTRGKSLQHSEKNKNHDIAHILNVLSQKALQGVYKYPVRVLLLEREYKSKKDSNNQFVDWYSEIIDTTTEDKASILSAAYNNGTPLELTTLTDRDLKLLAQDTINGLGKKNILPETFIDDLSRVDPQKRPLFAIALAVYLASTETKTGFTQRQDLLEYILRMEFEKKWNPSKLDIDDFELISIATLCNGIPVPVGWTDTKRLSALRFGIVHTDSKRQQIISPVLPDMLGEYFIISNALGKLADAGRLNKIMQEAWTIAPINVAKFLDKCSQDFLLDEMVFTLFSEVPSGKSAFERWAWAAIRRINSLTSQGETDLARNLYDKFAACEQTDYTKLLFPYAASDIIFSYIYDDNIDDAEKIFYDLLNSSDEYKNIAAELALPFIITTHNIESLHSRLNKLHQKKYLNFIKVFGLRSIAKGYASSGKIERSLQTIRAMQSLDSEQNIQPEIADVYVAIMQNQIDNNQLQEAEKNITKIRNSGEGCERQLCKAHNILAEHYSKEGKFTEAETNLHAMIDLGKRQELFHLYIDGYTHLITEYIHNNRVEAADKLLLELIGIVGNDYNDSKMAYLYASIVSAYIKSGNISSALKYFDKINVANGEGCRVYKANSLANIVGYYVNSNNIFEAERQFSILKSYERNYQIQDFINISASYLAQYYTSKNALNKARTLFEEMTIKKRNIDSTIHKANLAGALISAYLKWGEIDNAIDIFNILVTMKDYAGVERKKTSACFSLIAYLCSRNDMDEAKIIFSSFKHKYKDAEMNRAYALSSSLMITGYIKQEKYTEAREILSRLNSIDDDETIRRVKQQAKEAIAPYEKN